MKRQQRFGWIFVMVLAAAGPLKANTIVVADNFEGQTAGAVPTGHNWVVSSTTATQTVLVNGAQQSPFGQAGDSKSVELKDQDNTAGLFSQKLENTTALPTNADFSIQFDIKCVTLSENPSFLLYDSTNTVAIQFGFAYPIAAGQGQIFYNDGSTPTSQRIVLESTVQNQWYRMTMRIHNLTNGVDAWDLRIQRHDGTSIVADNLYTNLDFRADVSNITLARFVFNTGPSQGGDLLIDNYLVVIPAPAALPGGLALMALVIRRRQ